MLRWYRIFSFVPVYHRIRKDGHRVEVVHGYFFYNESVGKSERLSSAPGQLWGEFPERVVVSGFGKVPYQNVHIGPAIQKGWMKKTCFRCWLRLLHQINLFLSIDIGCFSFFFSLFFTFPFFSGFEPTADDGRTPKQPPGMYKAKVVNNGIDSYQPQLVSLPDFSHQQYQPSTVHPRRLTAGNYSHHPWQERTMIIWTKPPGNYVQNVNLKGVCIF